MDFSGLNLTDIQLPDFSDPSYQPIKDFFLEIGKDKAKDVVSKIFSREKDDFKQIVVKVVRKLDEEYNHQLFGRNMVQVLTRPECIEIYKRYLFPFDEPTESSFKDLVDFSRLPGFLSRLKNALLEELIKSEKFKTDLSLVYIAYRVDGTGVNVEYILNHIDTLLERSHDAMRLMNDVRSGQIEHDGRLDEIIRLIHRQTASHVLPVQTPIKRPDYPAVPDYIGRSVSRRKIENGIRAGQDESLIEAIKIDRRVVLLSSAGLGKTSEIQNLAHHYSHVDFELFPVRIKLNTYTNQNIELILDNNFKDWRVIPINQLLLILDGLDEVHSNYFEEMVSSILNFAKAYDAASIVVTCRDNFFNEAFFNREAGFEVYRLKELSFNDVKRFIELKIKSDAELFLNAVQSHEMIDICYSPFFLVALIDDFSESRTLAKSKVELFERLVKRRMKDDIAKFASTSIRLSKHTVQIGNIIGRLALIMETLGRNYITEEELQKAVADYDNGRKLLEHTFLLEKEQFENWQFQHNNFQEYLAARALSNRDIDGVIDCITFSPNFRRIKPSWLNTVSFLFSILSKDGLEFDKLLEVLVKNNPEVLLRFEKERIDLKVREEIFRAILEEYHAKGVIARSSLFGGADLALFVEDSRDSVRYLITLMQNDDVRFVDACRMLPYFIFVVEFRTELQRILEDRVCRDDVNSSLKYDCIRILSDLNWRDSTSFERLEKSLPASDPMNSAAVFQYLQSSGFQDQYLSVIIKRLSSYRRPGVQVKGRNKYSLRLGGEAELIATCVLSLRSEVSIKKILEFYTRSAKNGRSALQDSLLDGSFRRLLLARMSKILSPDNSKLLKAFVNFYLAIYRLHGGVNYEDFRETFIAGDVLQKVCRILFKKHNDVGNYLFALGHLADQKFLMTIINLYKKGRIQDNEILGLRNALNIAGREDVFKWYYEEILRLSSDKFSYPARVDGISLRKLKMLENIESILDRDIFRKNMVLIFQIIGQDEVHSDTLWSLSDFVDSGMEYSVELAVIRDMANHGTVNMKTMSDWLDNEEKWCWFQINKLLDYDTNRDVELSTSAISFLKKWCEDNLKIAQFATAVNDSTYRYLESYLAYLIPRFDLIFSTSVYLDLLWIDSGCVLSRMPKAGESQDEVNFSISDWVISKVGGEQVRSRIIDNLTEGISSFIVRLHHFSMCMAYNIREAIPFIETDLLVLGRRSYQVHKICEVFLALGGDPKKIEKVLWDNILTDTSDQLRLIENLLAHDSQGAVLFMEKQLEICEDEIAIKFAHELIKAGQISGFKYYKERIRRNQRFDDFISFRQALGIPVDSLLTIGLEIVEIYLSGNFDPGTIRGQNQDLLEGICELAAKFDVWHSVVREKFCGFIDKYNAIILHHYIERIDILYYTNKTSVESIDAACKRVDFLMRS